MKNLRTIVLAIFIILVLNGCTKSVTYSECSKSFKCYDTYPSNLFSGVMEEALPNTETFSFTQKSAIYEASCKVKFEEKHYAREVHCDVKRVYIQESDMLNVECECRYNT